MRQMEKQSPIYIFFSTIHIRTIIFAFLFLLGSSVPMPAQDLPDKILGYKVHRPIISISNNAQDPKGENEPEANIKVEEPELIGISLDGVSLSVAAAITSLNQSGKVDFLTFHDFRVNDIPVDIEKYDESFSFNKNEPIDLPKPATLTIPTGRILKATWNEIRDSKKEWTVTGRVFVFGRVRKFGFNFKRVVPIDIKLTIKNPLI